MRAQRSQKGQTLVLAALTALLLTLMLLFTLSLGWRVRDRIENQMTADAAAYSQAVDVARVYNEIALMNRTQLAMQVSVLAMSSLISWSSHYYSNLAATELAMGEIVAYYSARCCPLFCPCECIEAVRSSISLAAVMRERARVRGIWTGLETAAAGQLREQWLGAEALFSRTRALIADQLLDARVHNQKLASTIARLASPELAAPPRGDWKFGKEIQESIAFDDDDVNAVQGTIVTMGTRGDDFVSARTGSRQPIYDKLQPPVQTGNSSASVDPAVRDGRGGTAIGDNPHDNAVRSADPGMPWAEDHGGSLTISWPSGCSTSAAAPVRDAQLASGWGEAVHRFTPGDGASPQSRHLLTATPKQFPNMTYFAYKQMNKPNNDFGQPKVYALLDRDYKRVGAKPWDLRFEFAGSSVDMNAPSGRFKSPSGADLQHQTALGSAIVYYHRPDAWREPPNFFNPFWRATLYAADKEDLRTYLREAGFPQHGDTMKRLLDLRWEGTR